MEHDLIFQDKLLFGVPITTAPFLLPGGTATKSCSPVGVVTWQDEMVVPLFIIHFYRICHSKPPILGYPH